MRLLIQRVKEARVTIDGSISGQIGYGLLVFLGIHKDDSEQQVLWLVNKIVGLRIFPDAEKKMNLDITQVNGEILVVSQFTLYGNCNSGKRPDFFEAAPPPIAKPLYNLFIQHLCEKLGKRIPSGIFGALMEVALINDGPVTLFLEN